jgi:hypothetical protein
MSDLEDERLASITALTEQGAMHVRDIADVHRALLELKRRRAADKTASAIDLDQLEAAAQLADDVSGTGVPDALRIAPRTLRALLAEIRRHRAAQTASAERVRAVVREAAADVLHPNTVDRSAKLDAIADRVAAQLTAPPAGHVYPPAFALGSDQLDVLSELLCLAELSDWPRARAVIEQIIATHRAPNA